jgi:asparagine synthase (glutamine-hydrolysing)
VVFYDGLPVTVSTSLDALDAASLGARWTDLADLLEGQFVIVRVRPHERTVELKGDPLGLEQIYVLEQGGARYCSNSARLLEGIAGHSDTIDLTSAAMMASIGWVGGNRTLHPRVRVLPPGQHWS